GRLARSGSELRVELNPAVVKLAIDKGVIVASVPPATAMSASPCRIIVAAEAIASRPDGHAEEIVVARAEIPSAIVRIWVAAWGWESMAPELTPRGPRRDKSSKPASTMSIAVLLTPSITGIG